jgi:hypothetical protein
MQCKKLLLAWVNQAAFVRISPTIGTQEVMGRQQLDSCMSLTFSQELLDIGKYNCMAALMCRKRIGACISSLNRVYQLIVLSLK